MNAPRSSLALPVTLSMLVLGLCLAAALAQTTALPVTVQVEIGKRGAAVRLAAASAADASDVAIWLTPLDPGARPPVPRQAFQMVQRNKSFEPHLLVVPVGSVVQFPNKDPFFHNIFSLFDGKRFDLGLYEAGISRSVHFGRPGVSFLFCNIHPEMSAVVLAVDTPYYAVSDRSGRVAIAGVPDGRYRLHVWYERSLDDDLKALTRVLTLSDASRVLEPIQVPENPAFTLAHKNKYGQDYVPPPSATYGRP